VKANDRPEWPAIPAMCESRLYALSPGIMITDQTGRIASPENLYERDSLPHDKIYTSDSP
jgi:hypothetical protein